jgi:hypothetical protein
MFSSHFKSTLAAGLANRLIDLPPAIALLVPLASTDPPTKALALAAPHALPFQPSQLGSLTMASSMIINLVGRFSVVVR